MEYGFLAARESYKDLMSDGTPDTSERQYTSTAEDDHDSVFKTCISGKTKNNSLSSLRAQAKDSVSRRLNWGRPHDPVRPASRSDLTDSTSEGSSRSDMRSFLSGFYNAPGTPTRTRCDGAVEWSASRHIELEALREELEARLSASAGNGGVTFTPALREQTVELSNVSDSPRERTRRDERFARAAAASRGADTLEMAECTFHPCVSPNSSLLFRRAAKERGEGDLSVFQRLFPRQAGDSDEEEGEEEKNNKEDNEKHRGKPNKGKGQRGKRMNSAAAERRALARAEREAMRERCGALTAARAGGDSFELFLHNALGAGEGPLPYVRTAYRSSAAIAVENAPDATRRKCPRYRLALFDEFISRQNAHFTNRTRCVQALEDALTPSFKPVISETSTMMAKEMLARSGAINNSVNGSVLASVVKKHRSPYVDECTFKPRITAVSSAMAPRGAKCMMLEATRWRKARERAQEKAKAEEVQHPFRPTLNDDRNAHVESLLHPKNYARYNSYLRRRESQLNEMKREKDAKQDCDGVDECTFCPKITRPPAYVARMASSFALVRQQYGEL